LRIACATCIALSTWAEAEVVVELAARQHQQQLSAEAAAAAAAAVARAHSLWSPPWIARGNFVKQPMHRWHRSWRGDMRQRIDCVRQRRSCAASAVRKSAPGHSSGNFDRCHPAAAAAAVAAVRLPEREAVAAAVVAAV
jgi:hypothetical protein